jgi:phospholipid/cholesterol/gamma-HCH transport system permease protein
MSAAAQVEIQRTGNGTAVLRISGDWLITAATPGPDDVQVDLTAGLEPRTVAFDSHGLGTWDTSILTFVIQLSDLCRDRGIDVDRSGLPQGVQNLLGLAEAVPEKEDARTTEIRKSVLEQIGEGTLSAAGSLGEMLEFLGHATITFARLAGRSVRFRRSDLMVLVQQAGAEALGIVTLISFLIGLILAFVGAAQLEQFGAAIYVADLVGVAMVRDVGALMTAIVMAGRSGAAYAAELGSMKVTQEIDALTTMGISPLEFLVIPRILALALMMPLLTIYADFMGILGGAFVGISMLDLSFTTYIQQTAGALSLHDLVGGLFKAAVYGILVALAGCLRGMQSGTSSSAVGVATTSAVVTSIVLIISACGAFAVIFYALGI